MYNRVRETRLSKNMTVLELSNKTGLSRNTIYLLEDEKTVPSLETVAKVSSGLGVKAEKIFNLSVTQVLQDGREEENK
ncbi:helix-turn-helix domain-containing protein [Staphylococcus arlettae]|uniref:helix-turn-helix transcriptional regulator n=1 Tax=Staphylococcus arlettae TaxID=29378 RepID=UPI001E5299DE|nr:helix-turn-helix transcriptional regulator [Staphylococcus arlettae]MCD8888767.1 helix-turn-helix domain-containing protein [Staphylococcus arlettae]